MKLTNITDIFFDLDHTLWDFDKNSALTFQKIFELNHVNLDLQRFLEVYVPVNLNYWKLYREDKIDKSTLRYGRLADTFKALEYPFSKGLVNQLSDDYIAHLTSFNHLFENTVPILQYLQPKYNLHIITNGFKEVQYGKLEKAKINHFFKTVTNSEMVGVKKPHPKIFNHALEQASAQPQQSIMIGDNYEADILGALNMGFDAICFNYHKLEIDAAVKQIDNLIELQNYF